MFFYESWFGCVGDWTHTLDWGLSLAIVILYFETVPHWVVKQPWLNLNLLYSYLSLLEHLAYSTSQPDVKLKETFFANSHRKKKKKLLDLMRLPFHLIIFSYLFTWFLSSNFHHRLYSLCQSPINRVQISANDILAEVAKRIAWCWFFSSSVIENSNWFRWFCVPSVHCMCSSA